VCQVIPIFSELAENPWPFIGEGRKPLEERLLPVPEGLNIGRPLTRVRSIRLRRMDGIILISMTICLVGYCLVRIFAVSSLPNDILRALTFFCLKALNLLRFSILVLTLSITAVDLIFVYE
jgi:hypothetical protein